MLLSWRDHSQESTTWLVNVAGIRWMRAELDRSLWLSSLRRPGLFAEIIMMKVFTQIVGLFDTFVSLLLSAILQGFTVLLVKFLFQNVYNYKIWHEFGPLTIAITLVIVIIPCSHLYHLSHQYIL